MPSRADVVACARHGRNPSQLMGSPCVRGRLNGDYVDRSVVEPCAVCASSWGVVGESSRGAAEELRDQAVVLLPATAVVWRSLQPPHLGSLVAGLTGAAIVRKKVQPAHLQSRVAGLPATAVIRASVQPAHL